MQLTNLQYIAKWFNLHSENHTKQTISDKDKSKENLKTVYINMPETMANP